MDNRIKLGRSMMQGLRCQICNMPGGCTAQMMFFKYGNLPHGI
jgi:hypothetical protein